MKNFVIAVVNLKGGTAKTTTAVYLAHALHEQGRAVALVDADPQGSAYSWNEEALEPFPFPVLMMPTKDLYRSLRDNLPTNVDTVVIDTPPVDQKSGIVTGAVRAAQLVIVPMAPTVMEYRRLGDVADFIADVDELRPPGAETAILLNRVTAGTVAAVGLREQIGEVDGLRCFANEIRRREQIAQAYGRNINDAMGTPYGPVALEILEGRK